MPLIQKIEISNFLNLERGASSNIWRPRWPHQVFDLGGLNSALNIPNGKGKSSMVMAILAMLAGDRKALKEVSDFAFAPQRQSHYTHARLQVLVSSATSGGADLFSHVGGEAGGDPMVFGVYGNSGENGELRFYSYQGRFEDCPIAHANGFNHTFVDNKTFHAQLDTAPKAFPANRQEGTDRAWRDHVGTVFDMASLHQQLVYQKLRGAEGGHGYFDVHNPPGAEYSASVFYERLAPELLVESMGELGEEDEHGIEDTIHTKASQLIIQKHKSEQQERQLELAGNTLKELELIDGKRADLLEARRGYEEYQQAMSVEFAALKYVVVDKPIPGVPRFPDESMPIARSMVLQGGKWRLPDRVMAEFGGEPVSEVNRRAQERNGLKLEKLDRTQAIDFACHIKSRDARGKPNQLYSRENAIALVGLTTNFTRDWTKQSAIDAVNHAFDWVETHGDTNPARAIRYGLKAALEVAEENRRALNEEFEERGTRLSDLADQQLRIGEEQSAHRAMLNSRLFTEAELADPEGTGADVEQAYNAASQAVDQHKERMLGLRDIHAAWEAYQHEHADIAPGVLASQLEAEKMAARTAFETAKKAREDARMARGPADQRLGAANQGVQVARGRLQRFQETAPAVARFAEVFRDVSPIGLAERLQAEAKTARDREQEIKSERSRMSEALEALQEFRERNGDSIPSEWLQARQKKWEELGQVLNERKGKLTEAQILRAGLDKEVIVAGKVAREAASVAGGKHRSLHAAIDSMPLEQDRRERALTLFSALLHAPVYKTAEEARGAAARLEEAGIEAPVFLQGELEAFCRTGEISMNAAFAHTWLVGIRTRQVECLLDPSLVGREKARLDKDIQDLTQGIAFLKEERGQCSPDSEAANIARKAAEAVSGGYEERDSLLVSELARLGAELADLETRSSHKMIAIIQATEKHQKEFGKATEADLLADLETAETERSEAQDALDGVNDLIRAREDDVDAKQGGLQAANDAAMQVGNLRKVQAYLDDPENNPSFMAEAPRVLSEFEAKKLIAEARTRFSFTLAAAFLKHGTDYAKNIEEEIKEHKLRRGQIQDKLLPEVNGEIAKRLAALHDIEVQERDIDRLVHEVTRMYRAYADLSEDLLPVKAEAILETPLGAQTVGLHEAQTDQDRADLLIQMLDELDFEGETSSRQNMVDAKSTYSLCKTEFDGAIKVALAKSDLNMSEHVRAELERAKASPEIVSQLHAAARLNYERNKVANDIASKHLDAEWEKIGQWLANFTKRLKKNHELMKKVFAPTFDKDTKEILNSGFEIEGKVAEDADIRAVLDGVVATIEKEENERAGKSFTVGEEKKRKTDLRKKIRDEFYRSVITGVRIKVCMPSISKYPLALERKMVSTGQGIAMALMWIVKMAEFTTKRWQNEQASSAAQRKRIRHTQFTIIDGAFSSLSDEGLIKDALDSIEATKGNFQLIITDHDPDYRNNFDYFPTLIVAKELGGRFMLAERKTKEQTDPGAVGLPKGALGLMSVRAVPRKSGVSAET